MKRLIITLLAISALCIPSQMSAQSWLEGLGKKAVERAKDRTKYRVEQKINEKVDNAVDKTFETAEGVVKGEYSGQEEQTQQQYQEQQNQAEYQQEQVQQTQVQQEVQQAQTKPEPQISIEVAYAKSDFVPGDEIIFEDNLTGEQLGEFPSQWDLVEGVAEVTSLAGKEAIGFIEGSTKICPLMKNQKSYLPEIYTIEYDFYIPAGSAADNQESPEYRLLLYNEEEEIVLNLGINDMSILGNGVFDYYKPSSGNRDRVDGVFRFENVAIAGEWNHFALSFNKRACKAYINGTRVVNIPNMDAARFLHIEGPYHQHNYHLVTNFRIAQGAVPLYDRMMTDGKFVTYGITFDVGKSAIKPESMGEINRIVQLMNENPSLKFSVEGHTDATGNSASNQKLSEERAKAIVDKLVENGIAADRLSAVGKGQNNPIADNSSDEGRAKNRRVEFVKL